MPNATLFNPLDKKNLGKSIVDALIETEEVALSAVGSFVGAGIYAIYYRGKFSAYRMIADLNSGGGSWPIYVGKAIPSGGRKGASFDATTTSIALSKRLAEHVASISSTPSLALADFSCRYLRVDDIWIALGETLLIERYKPVWNLVVEGFGNHDPGSGRYRGKRPLWDELHPGRGWAQRCDPPRISAAQIIDKVTEFLSSMSEGTSD